MCFKPFAIILTICILIQSCAVYHRAPVSLDDAAKTNKRVLLITTDNKKIRLKRIQVVDGLYYGITNDSRESKIVLDEKTIKALRPIDQAKTNLGNFGWVIFGVVVIVGFVIAATYDPI